MTIDITVGKIVFKSDSDIVKYIKSNEYYSYNTLDLYELFDIEQCPDEDDGCTTEDTFCPGESYRSGSNTAISEFFRIAAPSLHDVFMRHKTNDLQVTKLQPHIKSINALTQVNDKQHNKRLHWLKFWCNKAVELYGKDAVIKFS